MNSNSTSPAPIEEFHDSQNRFTFKSLPGPNAVVGQHRVCFEVIDSKGVLNFKTGESIEYKDSHLIIAALTIGVRGHNRYILAVDIDKQVTHMLPIHKYKVLISVVPT